MKTKVEISALAVEDVLWHARALAADNSMLYKYENSKWCACAETKINGVNYNKRPRDRIKYIAILKTERQKVIHGRIFIEVEQ